MKQINCTYMNAHVRGGERRVCPGGVYHSMPSIFQRLDNENIGPVPESLHYYPYYATFNFEYYFDTTKLPSNSSKVQLITRHIPWSISEALNVPGQEEVQSLFTDGYPEKLVVDMMDILRATSDAAYEDLKDSYEDVLEELPEAITDWDEREEVAKTGRSTNEEARHKNPTKRCWINCTGGCISCP